MKVTAKNLFSLPDGTRTVAQNLYVRVKEGRGYYIFRYTTDGKRKDMSLGSIKKIALKDAKLKAGELRLKLANDQPLKEEKKVEPQAETVESYGRRVVELIISVRQFKREEQAKQVRRNMQNHVYPAIGDVLITDVTREDVLKTVRGIWIEQNPTAVLTLGILRTVLSYAVADGLLPFNPAVWDGNLELFLPSAAKVHSATHHACATLEEASAFVNSPIQTMPQAAAVFATLTASRRNEAALARWEEFDFDTATWLVPPERRKDRKPFPHRVPLSEQAVRFLRSLPRVGEFVFPGQNNAAKPVKLGNVSRHVHNHLGVTMHGMRSTFRDWCAENEVPEVLAEKSLMHSTGNAVVQAYQRSDLLELRRPVMQMWAEALCDKAFPRLDLRAKRLTDRLSKSPDPSDNAGREEPQL